MLEDAPAQRALQGWLSQRPPSQDKHVFLNYRQEKLSTTSISHRINRACRLSGVSLTAHRLRHSFADHLLSAGMPITSIQKLMGHRFVETTQNYAVANDKQVQADFYQACEKLEGWRLLMEANPLTDILLQEQMQAGQENVDEVLHVPIAVPARLSQFPAELARQLEAYRQLKANRWRVERVSTNSTSFYSLHGRLWEFFGEKCCVKTVSELQLDHVRTLYSSPAERWPLSPNDQWQPELAAFVSVLSEGG